MPITIGNAGVARLVSSNDNWMKNYELQEQLRKNK
jgi:hypothetical protein